MLLWWREEKTRKEKRREGKGREEKRREEQEQQETQAISSRDYSTQRKRDEHIGSSAGEEQEWNKEANKIKHVQGLKNKDHVC